MSQQAIPVVYENVRIDTGFRADLVVEDMVIVEIKSVESRPGPQEATPDLSPTGRQAAWLADQLSRAANQRRHFTNRQWT